MRRLAVAVLLAGRAWAGYQYYLTDNLTTIDPAKWISTGTPAATKSGLSVSDANGGSLISRLPVPDGSSEAEVSMT